MKCTYDWKHYSQLPILQFSGLTISPYLPVSGFIRLGEDEDGFKFKFLHE